MTQEKQANGQEAKPRPRRRNRFWLLVAIGFGLYLFNTDTAQAALFEISGQSFSDWIYATLKDWLVWAICFLLNLAWPIIEPVLDAIPDGYAQSLEPVSAYVAYTNYWVPLDLAFQFAVANLIFALLYFAARYLIKLIPGIG